MTTRAALLGCLILSIASTVSAVELEVGDAAPLFTAKTHAGEPFDLASRKGQWTVLFFYPKADTPGCTAQVGAYRDGIGKIRAEGAEVFGISTDEVEDQASFHAGQDLTFTLLSDPEGAVVEKYGSKMPIVTRSKRWTFIIDPELKIRHIEHDVDPQQDAGRVAAEIARLKREGARPAPAQ
jgi:peroxiredoxin Q/BCP